MEASDEMVSTISSAGCLAASMARRTSSMREMAPVEVSLWTTHTALMVWPLSSRRRASMAAASAPLRQSRGDELRLQAELDRHVLPQRGEVAGLVHQHLVAGRERVDERRLPRAGAGRGIDEHRARGLEDGLDAGQHLAGPAALNSGPRWSITGMSMARRMRSGTGVGPGICRKWRPARRGCVGHGASPA